MTAVIKVYLGQVSGGLLCAQPEEAQEETDTEVFKQTLVSCDVQCRQRKLSVLQPLHSCALCVVTVKPLYQFLMPAELNPLWFRLVMRSQNVL